MILNKRNYNESLVFSEEELAEINEIRKNYEEFTDREKFIIQQALKPYFYTNKMK